MKEDNVSQVGDYDEHSVNISTRMGYISLFKFKLFDQFNTPKLPQIFDIAEVTKSQCNRRRQRRLQIFLKHFTFKAWKIHVK